MLISDIITEIMTDVGADLSDTVLTGKMLTFLKGGLRMIPVKARSRLLTAVSSVSLAENGYSVAVPTGFRKEVSDQSLWYVEGGSREPIIKYQRDDFTQIFNDTVLGPPKYFRIIGSTIEFDRRSEVARTIYVEHFKDISSVVAGDTFVGDDSLISAAKLLTKHIYFNDYEEDESRGKTALALAQDILQEIDSEYMENELGSHVEEA